MVGKRRVIARYTAAELDFQPLAQALIKTLEGVKQTEQETQCAGVNDCAAAIDSDYGVHNNRKSG